MVSFGNERQDEVSIARLVFPNTSVSWKDGIYGWSHHPPGDVAKAICLRLFSETRVFLCTTKYTDAVFGISDVERLHEQC